MSRNAWTSGGPSLVIDACVAKSASGTDHPYSRRAREVLETVLTARVHVLFSDSVNVEWAKHASMFSTRWRAMMVSRSLAVSVKDKQSALLRKRIKEILDDPADVAALLKDTHLFEL